LPDFGYWHKAGVVKRPSEVRFRRDSGQQMLKVSFAPSTQTGRRWIARTSLTDARISGTSLNQVWYVCRTVRDKSPRRRGNFDNLDELLAARAERCPTFFAFVAGQASILM
jgi:hypothetical protein